MANYDAGIYPGNGSDRARWAVACKDSGVWYFPTRYGRKAAESMAARMNARA